MFYQALVFSMGWAKSQIPTCFDRFWPPPANPVQFFGLKMPSKCVPWIVLQVSSSTRTSRGSLRPPKRPSKARNGQKSRFFWSRPKIVGQRGKNWPSRISPMIGELITLKDPPSKVNRLGPTWIPPVKKNASWPIYKFKSIYIQKKVLGQNKMSQTQLKSFNGRQWGILQSISGVSGASGGLWSPNFDFLTQKFKMAVFARFRFLKSKNPISGHN